MFSTGIIHVYIHILFWREYLCIHDTHTHTHTHTLSHTHTHTHSLLAYIIQPMRVSRKIHVYEDIVCIVQSIAFFSVIHSHTSYSLFVCIVQPIAFVVSFILIHHTAYLCVLYSLLHLECHSISIVISLFDNILTHMHLSRHTHIVCIVQSIAFGVLFNLNLQS